MEKDSKDLVENMDDLKVGGYGYWKRESDLVNNEQFIPKETVNATQVQESKVTVGSAWNTAGTWEEKHYNKKQVEDYFNSNIQSKSFTNFKLTSISSYSGDIYTFFVRQKAKLVYDCELTLNIESGDKDGKIELTDVNNHETDSDFNFSYKIKDSALSKQAKSAEKQIQDYIKELFNNFWESQKK